MNEAEKKIHSLTKEILEVLRVADDVAVMSVKVTAGSPQVEVEVGHVEKGSGYGVTETRYYQAPFTDEEQLVRQTEYFLSVTKDKDGGK